MKEKEKNTQAAEPETRKAKQAEPKTDAAAEAAQTGEAGTGNTPETKPDAAAETAQTGEGNTPEAKTDAATEAAQTGEAGAGEKKITVGLRHKTDYPLYRRAGLVLKQTRQTYEVSAAQLAALEKDIWVAVEK
jgi:hypothetical protein